MNSVVFIAFIAGALTVAAPCILPFLPVVLGASIGSSNLKRPLIIITSLAISVLVFSIILKGTTALLGVPQVVWQIISGTILILLGVNYFFPSIWQKFAVAIKLNSLSSSALSTGSSSFSKEILTGFALGPIFNSCSPTYALIVAIILPANFAQGLVYLLFYVLGLALMLLLIVFLGSRITSKLLWFSDETSWIKKALGGLLIILGFIIIFGVDKTFLAYALDNGWYDWFIATENFFERR
ncbi:cytochrome C biogenesis protein [Candidatus Berkelbacteria bacterium]|nr:cytochrome C biogenesis protein [Candidatus Berkelbacteria bacterium]